MPRDRYQAGKPLSPKGLFQLVAEEAFKDGKIDPVEQEILFHLARFLGIPSESARRIAGQSLKKFQAGSLGTARPLDAAVLYERVLYFAWSDGQEDSLEEKMLAGLRRLFRISDESHQTTLAKVRHPDYGEGTRIDEAPPTEEVSLGPSPPEPDPPREPVAPPVRETPPARQAGEKAGSSRFPIRPGGIPIPVGPQVLLGLLGLTVAGLPLILLSTAMPEDQEIGEGFFTLALAAGFGAYWWARKAYEGTILPQDAALVVSARGLVVPGAFRGEGGEWKISRQEVEEIRVTEEIRSQSRNQTRKTHILNLQIEGSGHLSIYETALEADFDRVCQEMEAYLLRPIQRVESQSISSGFMLFLAIFFGLILVVVLVIAFSS